jgi:acyl-CoA thioester hydrolase
MNILPPHEESVLPAWIDHNGHMNLAYYVLVFDHATHAFLRSLSLDASYRRRTGCGIRVAETHTLYQRELLVGAPVSARTHLIAADPTELHIVQEMFHARDEFCAALQERILRHVRLSDGSPTDLNPETRSAIETILAARVDDPLPEGTGRRIAMPPPKTRE